MGPEPAVAAVRLAVRRTLADLHAAAPPAGLVLVACSGGADSLALAAATAREAPRAGLRAGAVTIDHGLQPGSAERAAETAALLRDRLRLDPVEVIRVAVGADGGPEAAARAARYAALDEAADRLGALGVLLAHTRDDQAETVLLGLARGSGARSLAGMAVVSGTGGRYRRPLLDLGRDTLRRACVGEGLPVWDDPHNADPSFTRVRVRTHALPALEAALRPDGTGSGVAAALARTARLLREDADALDAWAEQAAAAAAEPAPPPGALALRIAALEALPPAVRRRVLRTTALRAGSPPSDLTERHVATLDALITAWHGQGPLHLPGGIDAQRRYGKLLLARRGHAAPERA